MSKVISSHFKIVLSQVFTFFKKKEHLCNAMTPSVQGQPHFKERVVF